LNRQITPVFTVGTLVVGRYLPGATRVLPSFKERENKGSFYEGRYLPKHEGATGSSPFKTIVYGKGVVGSNLFPNFSRIRENTYKPPRITCCLKVSAQGYYLLPCSN
jgi:hypothetical protein